MATAYTRYADVHINTKGPGDARPTADQIVNDEGLEGKLTGKVAFITGCSSGIGIDTARAMKATGARVFAAVRDVKKGENALAGILEPGRCELITLDLDSLDSVRRCVADFLSRSSTLNILINNAGIMACPEEKTADGFERQMGTNHLAHFLLFQLLKPTLLKSSTPEFNSRVVAVSSTAHRYTDMNFDNITLAGEYEASRSYGQSKLANIWMANRIDRVYGPQGLHASSLNPGGIWTGLQKYVSAEQLEAWKKAPGIAEFMKNPAQGAATTVWAAVAKCWEGTGGKYLDNVQVAEPVEEGYAIGAPGYEKWAYDVEKEDRLWEWSLEVLGLPADA
ncbi:NAD(P)-binding protein [Mytilinidion resinicola]|uniref:NAD(P)-binding protein n=1 Tax=Mytilinidion resinicola TaxID=574789 RepID=A0A6A6YJE3_9PEZI|nr:NAD(P)-binding protein [Mytilinidion resinicola]KAF2808689.1 NAD(P)-binding protein [Mytilinidion resinicola]